MPGHRLPVPARDILGAAPHVLGFEVLPRRWVVERTLAWLMRGTNVTDDRTHAHTPPTRAGPGRVRQ